MINPPRVSASLVLYNTPQEYVCRVYESIVQSTIRVTLYLIDNSPTPCVDPSDFPETRYIPMPANVGFGAGHNRALREVVEQGFSIHFVLNPDVTFSSEVLEKMVAALENDHTIGLASPRVVSESGDVQHLCKLLPSPSDLFFRRFPLPFFKGHFERRNQRFELQFWNYATVEEIPVLSGCFMALRLSIVEKVGFFDDRFFMYLEDFDLTRRLGQVSRTVFLPFVTVMHLHARESYRNPKLLWIHILSSIKYFNKWGWFLDRERTTKNQATVERLTKSVGLTSWATETPTRPSG